jgi:hypothetical protein
MPQATKEEALPRSRARLANLFPGTKNTETFPPGLGLGERLTKFSPLKLLISKPEKKQATESHYLTTAPKKEKTKDEEEEKAEVTMWRQSIIIYFSYLNILLTVLRNISV